MCPAGSSSELAARDAGGASVMRRACGALSLAMLVVAGVRDRRCRPWRQAPPHYPDFVFPAARGDRAAGRSRRTAARRGSTLQAGDLGSRGATASNELLKRAPELPRSWRRSATSRSRSGTPMTPSHGSNAALSKQPAMRAGAGRPRRRARGRSGATPMRSRVSKRRHAADPSLDLTRAHRRPALPSGAGRRRAGAQGGRDERHARRGAPGLSARDCRRRPTARSCYSRELAGVERQAGRSRRRRWQHLRRRVQLDPDGPRGAHAMLGDLLEEHGRFGRRRQGARGGAGDRADPPTRIASGDAARARATSRGCRRSIGPSKLADGHARRSWPPCSAFGSPALLRAGAQTAGVVVTDIGGHWAAPWIWQRARRRRDGAVSEPHFQPQAAVRRADLARDRARGRWRLPARSTRRARSGGNATTCRSRTSSRRIPRSCRRRAVGTRRLDGSTADGAFEPDTPCHRRRGQ